MNAKRDHQHIDVVLEMVGDVWKRNPDLSLTQVLYAASRKDGWSSNDLLYLHDERICKGLLVILQEEKSLAFPRIRETSRLTEKKDDDNFAID